MNMIAIRALRRALNSSPRIISANEAEECDAHFDAGEWSGPAWSHIHEELHDEIVREVAAKFQMPAMVLDHQLNEIMWNEECNQQKAMRK